MSIKKILEELRIKIGTKDSELLAKKGMEEVEKVIEETKNEEVDTAQTAADTAYELYQDFTKKMSLEEKGKFVEKFANLLVEKNKIPYETAVEFIKTIMEEENISNKYIIDPVANLPDSKVVEITQSDNIPIIDRKQIAQNAIESREEREEQLEKIKEEEEKRKKREEEKYLKRLQSVYEKCDEEKRDEDITEEIENALKEATTITSKINEMKAKIVARKIAYNYRKYGYTFVSKLTPSISAYDMKELGIVDLAEEEYNKIIATKRDIKCKRKYAFDRKGLEIDILRKIRETYIKDYDYQKELQKIGELLKRRRVEDRVDLIDIFKTMSDSKVDVRVYRKILQSDLIESLQQVPKDKLDNVINQINDIINRRNERQKSEDLNKKQKEISE